MSDAELRLKLIEAFLPYAKAYCNDPGSVSLEVEIDPLSLLGLLRMAPADRRRIRHERDLRRGLQSAFRDLSLACDPAREALLDLDPP